MTTPQGTHLRIIPRLDVKHPYLVKGVRLEGFRVLGDPAEFAAKYGQEGADELIYQDIVASLYQRNNILSLVEKAARSLFVPLTVGGGFRSVEDIRVALRHGADRVVLNTAAVERPALISEAVETFGSQCIILAIEVVQRTANEWEPLVNTGRDRTGLHLRDWVRMAEDLGVGEFLLTSVDKDGTAEGMDIELLKEVRNVTSLPIVLHGGASDIDDLVTAWSEGADGVALATALHYGDLSIPELKKQLLLRDVPVRRAR